MVPFHGNQSATMDRALLGVKVCDLAHGGKNHTSAVKVTVSSGLDKDVVEAAVGATKFHLEVLVGTVDPNLNDIDRSEERRVFL